MNARRRTHTPVVALLALAFAAGALEAQMNPPAVTGVDPASGSGPSRSFVFSYGDPDGGSTIQVASVNFSNGNQANNSCWIWAAFVPEGVNLYLANDAGTVWLGPVLSRTQNALQNGQCTINAADSFPSTSGNVRDLTLAMSFKPAYAGSREIVSSVYDGTFWIPSQLVGSWTVEAAVTTDARRIGVRSNGAYWGAAGEQIDLVSGNLNFSVPLLKMQSRGGWGASIPLSYNSQMWRQDTNGTWLLGRDVGYV